MKCSIEIQSNNSINIKAQKLSKYEQNSINMEIDKINDIINSVAVKEFGALNDLKVVFSSPATKTDKNLEESLKKEKTDEGDDNMKNEEDHPLFDSVLDELEGKLLK